MIVKRSTTVIPRLAQKRGHPSRVLELLIPKDSAASPPWTRLNGRSLVASGRRSLTLPWSIPRQVMCVRAERANFDSHLSFIQTFLGSVIEPLPPATPLLTMVRLTEAVIAEVQKRQCFPLETFFFTMRLQLWPVFQKVVSEHCDSLKKLSERPSGYFSKASVTTDSSVINASIQKCSPNANSPDHPQICKCYINLFQSLVLLTEQTEETMIFSKCAVGIMYMRSMN